MNDKKLFENLTIEILNRFNNEADRLANKISHTLENETRAVIGENAYASGNLKQSVFSKVEKSTSGCLIRVLAQAPYSINVYEGTKPHFVPIEPLIKWIQKKGIITDIPGNVKKRNYNDSTKNMAKDSSAAYAISKSIAKKGTQGIKFLDIALRQALPVIEYEVKKTFL